MSDDAYEHPCEGWCQCRCGNHDCGHYCTDGEPALTMSDAEWEQYWAKPYASMASLPSHPGGWGSIPTTDAKA